MSDHPVCLRGFTPANPGQSEIGAFPAGACGPPTFPGSTLTLLSLTVPSPLRPSPHLPSSALGSVCSPILPSDTGRALGSGVQQTGILSTGTGVGGDDGHRKGGRTGSFQCLVRPAIPMSSRGQLPKEGAGGDPRKASSHGNCPGRDRGLDSVCAVFKDLGVIECGHRWSPGVGGRAEKESRFIAKRAPVLTLVIDLDPPSSRELSVHCQGLQLWSQAVGHGSPWTTNPLLWTSVFSPVK